MEYIYVFLGMAGMMLLYIAMLYYQLRTPIYAYYSIYILCWFIYFLVRLFDNFPYEWYEFTRVGAPMLSYIMYYRFSIIFVDLRRNQPLVYKLFHYTCLFLPFYIIFDAVLCFVFQAYTIHEQIHFVARIYIIVVSVFGIIKTARKLDKLFYYILWGSAFVIAGNTIAMVLSILDAFNVYPLDTNQIFSIPILYIEIGITLELLCFSLGLGYRQRLIEQKKIVVEKSLEQERKQYHIDKLQAVLDTQQQERIRVAAELHDDIGSGLSSIRFLSEKVLAKIPDSSDLRKISERSKELVDNMRGIIWMMSDNQATLEDLIIHIRKFAFQYLEENNINVKVKNSEGGDYLMLTNDQRRNIFLSVKECLHNIVKHARATEVNINIETGESLHISIADNGIGFEILKGDTGNGLKNMQKRMKSINGTCEIESHHGTMVNFSVTLTETNVLKDKYETIK